MGISRESRHKHRLTGGRVNVHQKKRKFEMGRPSAMTKLGSKRVVPVRVRGGNYKYRALRLNSGNFSWGTEVATRRTRILDVVYNASNNELVRTKTLVKNAVIQIDATPFRQYYEQHYGKTVGGKVKKDEDEKVTKKNQKKASHSKEMDPKLVELFQSGRLYAVVSSRPGQCGRADGYVLEGKELDFYLRKLQKKKGKAAGKA